MGQRGIGELRLTFFILDYFAIPGIFCHTDYISPELC